ncbi:hypothetical protein KDA_58410 [Dictyobacter alpinus]|uniref:DUF2382 domain-containing protein n=1 Tax=Dictyobacter alpinus TaxID=2014873 RepID=A0A402BGG1_9CHLR|nr:YsnF/AvaK domain-containing protein [Dictyobacter alpinus]GCE30325.1 hypothetical protein KDA_58090 [Dictyobacter alpinus]GCE30357.1 hypothetical protein KDA_58410 [Dictyobacter alpinus]
MSLIKPTLISVFDEPAMADDAINALEQTGIDPDQIYYSKRATSSGFFAELKRLFGGEDTDTAADLKDSGLSNEEADYYQNEHRAGRGIVAVNANGREQEALSTLQSYGARIYGTQANANQSTYDTTGTTTRDTDAYATDATATQGATGYDTTRDANAYATQGATGYDTTRDTDAYATDAAANNVDQNDRVYGNDNTVNDTYQDNRAYNNNRGDVMNQNDREYDKNNNNTYDTDATDRLGDNNDEQRRMRLREEQLNVGKDRVQSGEARLRKNVVSEEQNIDVPVSHEEVYVERRSVANGEVDNTTPIGEDEDIRVPVSSEQVNVSKDTVTTGEVAIGKRNVQENQRVSDTVRREEAQLDQQGDVPLDDRTTDNNR